MIDQTTAMEALPQPAASVPVWRAILRVALDFALGVALFALVVGAIYGGNGQALAGASGWVTTVTPSSGLAAVHWQLSGREVAFIILGLSFGAITAFNLAMARHLSVAAAPTTPSRHPQSG